MHRKLTDTVGFFTFFRQTLLKESLSAYLFIFI